MKVINFIMDARVGGPQLRIAEVGRVLKSEYNIETIVIFPEKQSEKFKQILKEYGLDYKAIRIHKLSKSIRELLMWAVFFIPETIKLVKLFKKVKADIIHTNASWQWKGVVAGKIAGKKVVWHLNDTKIPFYVRVVFRLLIKKTDAVIVAGSRVKKYYLKNFDIKKPVYEIQAPVDTEKFNPDKVRKSKDFEVYKGIKIGSVGNVNPYKGFEYLIEAAKILNKKYDNLYFFIAGNIFDSQKKYVSILKKKIRDFGLKNFILLGGVSNIAEFLKSIDIYVCSSISEASPQSVWEAMAMEKPIVSTDVGSVPDFIKDGENGFIVPSKNTEKLAEKIGILIKNPDLRKIFGKRSREIAIKNLDIKICAEKHREAYEFLNEKNF